jgi:hypothetical protein
MHDICSRSTAVLRNPGLQKHFSFAGLVVMRINICYGQGPILRKSGLDIY